MSHFFILEKKEKHEIFLAWAKENYDHGMEFTEVTNHYVQSGQYPEEFEEEFKNYVD